MSEPDEPTPLYQNRARATSFGPIAEIYDRTRPSYPDALIDTLVAGGATSAVDVGCGTGILGRQLRARGLSVLGVEPDELMANVARSHGLDVEVANFEDWPPGGRTFDLLISGQAWHWIEPVRGAARAAQVVAPGGRAALAWNHATLPDELTGVLSDVYARCAPASVRPVIAHRTEARQEPDAAEVCFPATGAFEEPEFLVFTWVHSYELEEWLDQLGTHSDHRLMDPGERAALLAEVGRAIDDQGGTFEMRYDCHVVSFARRG